MTEYRFGNQFLSLEVLALIQVGLMNRGGHDCLRAEGARLFQGRLLGWLRGWRWEAERS